MGNKINLELKLKNIVTNLNSEENRKLYNHCKIDLETIYDYIADDIKVRPNVNGMNMGEVFKVLFKPLKKVWRPKSNLETHCLRERNN